MKFEYLGVMISEDGDMEEGVTQKSHGGRKRWETLRKLWKENKISREIKRTLQ